jgi:PAS domain S-box-containing protein
MSTQTDPKQQHFNQDWVKFLDAMDEVFFSFDPVNKRPIQISGGCEKLYGVPVEELLANDRLWFEMIHPDDKHIALEEVNILKQGEQVNNQYRIIRADGEMRWLEKKIIPTIDNGGVLVRADGVVRDVTARKAAEEKQLQSEAFYRQIVETAQEGIWTIDANNKTTFVNGTLCDILGYSPEEMMGKELYDFMDEEGKAYAQVGMQRRRVGVREKLDIRYVTKSGKDVWANISANPIFDENGVYKGALAMVTDITQRRMDEESLKSSEANLRTIFENTTSAYVLFNDELRIVSFNTLAQQYSEEQNNKSLKVNELIKNYFSPERWGFVLELIERVKTDGSYSYELTYTKSNGEVKWHNVRWVAVKNNDNKNTGYILSNKDITRAKLAALEREKITTDLIRHNKDLEQFTYIVSHNLRAPVANIIGLADILRQADIDDETRTEILDRMSTSVKNVDGVIRDLNQILQAREPGNEEKEVVNFNSLCDDIRDSILDTAAKQNMRLVCDFSLAESIYTIRSYMYSIIYNLISNSIKYCMPGVPPVITIKTVRLKDKIEVRFKDNGKGIDLEKNGQHLFGLYKRFDTTVEGKGMGLFMVKTQVEVLGGTIRIESEPNTGTEFIMQFNMP